jgi:hypothetical protein
VAREKFWHRRRNFLSQQQPRLRPTHLFAAQNSRRRERQVLPYSDQRCVPFTFHEPSLSKPGNPAPLYRGLPCSPCFSQARSHFKAPKPTPPPLRSLPSQAPFRLRPEAWPSQSRVIAP